MPQQQPYNPRADHDDSFIQEKNPLTKWIGNVIGTITPKCREVTRIVSQGMDVSLPLLMRVRLRLHYLACCYCRRYAGQLYYIRKTSHSFPTHCGHAFAATLPDAVKERIKMLLRGEAGG
jgi:hypothetical protein